MDHSQLEKRHFDYLVVGAGFSGAYIAGSLQRNGVSVLIIDKARGTGGRLSSKRVQVEDDAFSYDLGAQTFEVTHPDFRTYLMERPDIAWCDEGLACAVPRNSGLARGALGAAETMFGHRVLEASHRSDCWQLNLDAAGTDRLVTGKKLILATPPKQAAEILGSTFEVAAELQRVEHEAQWVVMLLLEKDVDVWEKVSAFSKAASDTSTILQKIALDGEKPGRSQPSGASVIMLHASPDWTSRNLDADREEVRSKLVIEFARLIKHESDGISRLVKRQHVHRWLYSRPMKPSNFNEAFWNSPCESLLICGDYFNVNSGFGVESAFLSATSLLAHELKRIGDDSLILDAV